MIAFCKGRFHIAEVRRLWPVTALPVVAAIIIPGSAAAADAASAAAAVACALSGGIMVDGVCVDVDADDDDDVALFDGPVKSVASSRSIF